MNYPNQCYIELTQECNLKCAHCFAQGGPSKSSELTFEQVKSIYHQINDLGVIFVNISGGEPSLNKDFFKIVEFAANQPFETCVLTNGTTWRKEDIDKFATLDPNRNITIQISLDGPYEVMHKHRGITREQYNKIFETTKCFKDYGFSVTCLQVVDTVTAPFIMDTAKDALENKGFENVQIVPLFLTGRAIENIEVLEGFWSEWSKIVKEVTEIKKYNLWGENTQRVNMGFFTLYEILVPLEENNMLSDIKDVWGLDIFNLENYRRQIRRNFYCEGGCSELTISSDMNLFPCVASIRTSLNCGSLKDESLLDMWKDNKTLNWFRDDLHKLKLDEPCFSCKYKEFCGGGCRLVSLSLHGNLNALDSRCPYVIRHKKDMIK